MTTIESLSIEERIHIALSPWRMADDWPKTYRGMPYDRDVFLNTSKGIREGWCCVSHWCIHRIGSKRTVWDKADSLGIEVYGWKEIP